MKKRIPGRDNPDTRFSKASASPEEELLIQLKNLQKIRARKQNQLSDYHFFAGLCNPLQSLLGIYARVYGDETDFCMDICVEMNNWSVPILLSRREAPCQPEDVPAELKKADLKELEKTIAGMEEQMPVLPIALEWDTLTDRICGLLYAIIKAAEESCAAECRKGIVQLVKVLSEFQIEVLWFWNDAVQKDNSLQADFVGTEGISLPMLYWTGAPVWEPFSSIGCFIENIEEGTKDD